jgi:protein subunit release factor B
MQPQTQPSPQDAEDALQRAAQMYDRYVELSGVARLATDTETEDWLQGWRSATMQGNPVGLAPLTQVSSRRPPAR